MTSAVAVASGPDSAEHLAARLARGSDPASVRLVRHRELAVAFTPGSRWVDHHDDGGLLVVVDGRLHDPPPGPTGPARSLAARYRDRGVELATGLLGDFVVVVLDRDTCTLLVARDPVGVRPWYQATAGAHHAGAGDLAALVALPWVDTELDECTAIEYLAACYQSRGPTLYRGIRTLRAGETWHDQGGHHRTFAHHRWALEPEVDLPWDDAAERCRTVLEEAVACRLRDGEPATCELSGGMDSSVVVGTVAGLGRTDLAAARLVFTTPRADETAYSDAVIAHWGIPAVTQPPWIPTEDDADQLTRELARPVPDANFTMFASLHRALRTRGRPASLTGLGGDDAFAASGNGIRAVSALQLRQRRVLADLARWTLRHPRWSWRELLAPTLQHLAPWRGPGRPPWVHPHAAATVDLVRRLRRRPAEVTGIDAIDDRLANLTSGYDAAILEDRAALADRWDRRDTHPFLDPRVVRATYALDPWWPTYFDHTRALQAAAFADRLPPAVAERRDKADFSEVFWPQVLDRQATARVRSGPLAELGWLDPAGFERLVADAKVGMATAAIPLSRCLSLDRWLRTR